MRLHEITLLKKWVVVNDQAELFQLLVDELHKNEVMEGLSIAVVGKEFMVSGEKDAKSIAKITQIIEAFNRRDRLSLKAHYQNIPTAMQAEHILPSALISVGETKNPCICSWPTACGYSKGQCCPAALKFTR
ncbi:hypothetical protein O1V64_15145 [Rouxiella badensis]|nr:hypothetical protein O1V64_15145 [Rouxiella badensis]